LRIEAKQPIEIAVPEFVSDKKNDGKSEKAAFNDLNSKTLKICIPDKESIIDLS